MGSSVSCCSTDTVHTWNSSSRMMIGDVPPAPNNNNITNSATSPRQRGGSNLSNVVSNGDRSETVSSSSGGANFNDHYNHNDTNKHHRAVDAHFGGGSSSTPSLSARMPLSNTTPNGSFPAMLTSGGGDNPLLESSMPGSVLGSLSINFSITDGGSTNLGDGLLESTHHAAIDSPSSSSARGFHPSNFRGGFSGGGSGRGGSLGRRSLQDPPISKSPPPSTLLSPKVSTPPPSPSLSFQVGTANANSVAQQKMNLEHTHEDFILNNSSSSTASNCATLSEHQLGSSSPLGSSISRKGRRVIRVSQLLPPSSSHAPAAVNPLSASASTLLNASASTFGTSASALPSLLELSETQTTDATDGVNGGGVSEQQSHPKIQVHGGSVSQIGICNTASSTSSSYPNADIPPLNASPNQSLSVTAPLGGGSFNTVGALSISRNPSIGGVLSGSQSQMVVTPRNTTVVPPSIRDFIGSSRSKSNNSRSGIAGGGVESIVTPLNASDSEARLAHSRRKSHIVGGGPHIEVSPATGTNSITMNASSEQSQQHLGNLPAIRHRRSHSGRLWTPLSTQDSPGRSGRTYHERESSQGSFHGHGGGSSGCGSMSSSPQASEGSHRRPNSNSIIIDHNSCSSNKSDGSNMMVVSELPFGPDAFPGGSSPGGSSSSILCSKSMSTGADSTPRELSRRFNNNQKPHESKCSSGGGGGGLTHSRTTGSVHSPSHSYTSSAAYQYHLDSLLLPDQLLSSMSQAPPPHQLQGIFHCHRSEYHQGGHHRTNSSSGSSTSILGRQNSQSQSSSAMGTSPLYHPQPPTPRQVAQRSIRGAFEVDGRDKRLLRNN